MHLPAGDAHDKEVIMHTTNNETDTTFVSSVHGTDDRGALPKHWVAALVQVRSEKAVSKKLVDLNIENYVPTQWEIHQWSDRKKRVERVVIPMIVFVRTDKATIKRLITHPFIHKLISYPGQYTPAIIPDEQIARLRFMLRHAESPVEMRDQVMKTGDTVRITRGPLRDLEGELCRVDADKSMVAVLVECLGYACVNIDKSDITVCS